MNYIKRFVQGDYSLVQTFWVFYFIPTLIFTITREIFLYHDDNFTSPWTIIFIGIIYKTLCIIAVWNSSAKYTGKKKWFYLVRMYIAVEVTVTFIKFLPIIYILLLMILK